jgi:hypothetical protein
MRAGALNVDDRRDPLEIVEDRHEALGADHPAVQISRLPMAPRRLWPNLSAETQTQIVQIVAKLVRRRLLFQLLPKHRSVGRALAEHQPPRAESNHVPQQCCIGTAQLARSPCRAQSRGRQQTSHCLLMFTQHPQRLTKSTLHGSSKRLGPCANPTGPFLLF